MKEIKFSFIFYCVGNCVTLFLTYHIIYYQKKKFKELANNNDFEIVNYDITYSGYCNECKKGR